MNQELIVLKAIPIAIITIGIVLFPLIRKGNMKALWK